MTATAADPSTLDTRIVELMFSRLCHDLVSPVGAINNGVELIEEMGQDMVDDAMALIGQSGRSAAARLKLYRLAYGSAGNQAGLAMAEVREAARAWFDGTKIAFDWPDAVDGGFADPPAGWAKAILNTVLVAEEALGFGGSIAVEAAAGAGFTVTAEGRNAGLEAPAQAALEGRAQPEDLTPRTVQGFAAGHFARRAGFILTPSAGEGRLVLDLAA
jgi:histidine phosphotransferase ChpT